MIAALRSPNIKNVRVFYLFFFSWFGVPRQRICIYLPCEQRPVAAHTHTHISLLYPLPSPTPFSSEMFRFSSVISAHLLAYDHQCTEHLVRMKLCWGNWWEMRHTRCQPEILKHWKCVGFPKTGKEHQQKKRGEKIQTILNINVLTMIVIQLWHTFWFDISCVCLEYTRHSMNSNLSNIFNDYVSRWQASSFSAVINHSNCVVIDSRTCFDFKSNG